MVLLDVNAKNYKEFNIIVIDKNTGDEIKDVIWADDETGIYCKYIRDKDGIVVIKNNCYETEICKCAIKFKTI